MSNEWSEPKKIPIERIIVDDSIQIRVGLDEDRVNEFVEIYEQLPPIKVVRESSGFLLADGFHRYRAAVARHESQITVVEKEGSLKDALLIAIEENCKGPLNLSRAEKREIVAKVLRYFPLRANSWVAETVGVSMQTVESVRKSLEDSGQIEKLDVLETRDGRKFPRKISTNVAVSPASSDEDLDLAYELSNIKTEINHLPDYEDIFIDRSASKTSYDESKIVSTSSADRMFVDEYTNVKFISSIMSDDGKSAVGIKDIGNNQIAIIVYDLRGQRMFSVYNLKVKSEDFKEFASKIN